MRVTELVVALGMLAGLSQPASAGCDAAVTASLADMQRLANSLRADKPGLARVFAADGSEFTAGQVLWLKGQLREVQGACARGEEQRATSALAALRELIQAHAPRTASR